jgi:hypothetical protein
LQNARKLLSSYPPNTLTLTMKQNPSVIKLLGLLLIIFTLQSCEPEQPGSWKNENIAKSDREKFHKLNDELFKQLKVNNEKQLEYIMSKEFIDEPGKERKVELVSNRVKAASYSLLDEYYVINRYKNNDTVKTGTKGINSYTLNYTGTTHQMYLAFFIPKDGANKDMISAIYCKYDYGWKLNDLDVGRYTINGKTGPELFEQAKDYYVRGYLINALHIAESALNSDRPSNVWSYDHISEIRDLYDQLLKSANQHYKFPIAITEVATHPRIIRVSNQTTPEGDFPMIYYLSSIKLRDTTAIKRENEAIKKVINKTLPGIDKDKKYVLYSAFNEAPTGIKTVEHFDMTAKLK